MLTITTYIAPSLIEGVGVFAAEPIRKDQVISRFDPAFDRLIPRNDYENAPPYLKALLDRYAFPKPDDLDTIVYEVDNSRFMNHSASPNTDFSDFAAGIALRDIAAGEELTCDYNSFFSQYELLPPELELAAKAG
ncbi:MAG: SET domain-containing protein-lysine N-methyltransferase [Parvularculaceae bacterium]|nr:SET domain-containing protein-lysine N-methyltransferase [Parvularculaceae bacterium]